MTPFAKRVVVKTEISPEAKLQLQKLAMENKRSMRKQLEYIIEKAIKEEYGKENN
jgi:predicted transcriptional regulator